MAKLQNMPYAFVGVISNKLASATNQLSCILIAWLVADAYLVGDNSNDGETSKYAFMPLLELSPTNLRQQQINYLVFS